jgi:hypothetical protein
MTNHTRASADQKIIHVTHMCPRCFRRQSSSRENANFKIIVVEKRENKRPNGPTKTY